MTYSEFIHWYKRHILYGDLTYAEELACYMIIKEFEKYGYGEKDWEEIKEPIISKIVEPIDERRGLTL